MPIIKLLRRGGKPNACISVKKRFSSSSTMAPVLNSAGSSKKFQFRCTQCGKCCTGANGQVRVNAKELQAIVDFKQLSIDEFKKRFLDPPPSSRSSSSTNQFILKQDDTNTQCIFLQNGTKCSIYPVRPTQCRTFPWWPQNIVSRYDWTLAARDCEGIQLAPASQDNNHNKAPEFSYKQILPETIAYEIHRAGENLTYTDIQAMLRELEELDGDSFATDYLQELLQKHQRKTVFTNDQVTVIDTFFENVRPSRCFVFNNRPHLVQSEVFLTPRDSEYEKEHATQLAGRIDRSQLALEIHRAMSLPFLWLPKNKPLRIAVLGAGASVLPMFWLKNATHEIIKIDVVEPDAMVHQIATEFFQVNQAQHGGRLNVFECTAEHFTSKTAPSMYDVVVIDIEDGTSDHAHGIRAPPSSMLQPALLAKLHQILAPNGQLIMNTICTSLQAEQELERRLGEVFADGIHWRLPNNTMYCWFKSNAWASDHPSAASGQLMVDALATQTGQDRFQHFNAQTTALLQKHPVVQRVQPMR